MDGYLLIDKPLKWTSFDVVNRIRYRLAGELGVKPKTLKVGHAGTLDPLASGLLIVLIGNYTKRQAEFMKQDKTYEAQVILGHSSTTDDREGELTAVSDVKPTKAAITSTLMDFIGQQEQMPPQFSAVKVKGRPAYARVRAGEDIQLKTKTVTIFAIDQVVYTYPKLNFVCRVSSGTYIRALARDLGQKLGTGAYLGGLKRTKIGKLALSGAHTLDELDSPGVQPFVLTQP